MSFGQNYTEVYDVDLDSMVHIQRQMSMLGESVQRKADREKEKGRCHSCELIENAEEGPYMIPEGGGKRSRKYDESTEKRRRILQDSNDDDDDDDGLGEKEKERKKRKIRTVHNSNSNEEEGGVEQEEDDEIIFLPPSSVVQTIQKGVQSLSQKSSSVKPYRTMSYKPPNHMSRVRARNTTFVALPLRPDDVVDDSQQIHTTEEVRAFVTKFFPLLLLWEKERLVWENNQRKWMEEELPRNKDRFAKRDLVEQSKRVKQLQKCLWMDTNILKDLEENILKYTFRCMPLLYTSYEECSQLPDVVLMQARVSGLMNGYSYFGRDFDWQIEIARYEQQTGKPFPASYAKYSEWKDRDMVNPNIVMNVFHDVWLVYQTRRTSIDDEEGGEE